MTPEQLAREVREALIGFYGTEDSSHAVLAALVRTLGLDEQTFDDPMKCRDVCDALLIASKGDA